MKVQIIVIKEVADVVEAGAVKQAVKDATPGAQVFGSISL